LIGQALQHQLVHGLLIHQQAQGHRMTVVQLQVPVKDRKVSQAVKH
jgi:hypothetical protein